MRECPRNYRSRMLLWTFNNGRGSACQRHFNDLKNATITRALLIARKRIAQKKSRLIRAARCIAMATQQKRHLRERKSG